MVNSFADNSENHYHKLGGFVGKEVHLYRFEILTLRQLLFLSSLVERNPLIDRFAVGITF